MKVNAVKTGVNSVLGVLLVLLVVLSLFTHWFGAGVSASAFATTALVLTALALLAGFFRWVSLYSAAFFAAVAVFLIGATVYMSSPSPKSAQYQAVFLTNGQVYFGHLENASSRNPLLKDVYYLQSNSQNPQQANTQSANSQLSLVKLGNELHGPESEMVIKGDQVLFWENLKDSGKVVQAIHQYQQKK
ncbi:MAG TPA: hypothetical protein VFB03_02105 [Candidatus Saccharimonadales bacterium]|nr:hypothetical protein [Candidatus Saccharimonadales bacterium]